MSRNKPTNWGAAYPEILPTELMKAMPPAAAVAPRKAVGRFQNQVLRLRRRMTISRLEVVLLGLAGGGAA